jgi:hypothetical protein
VGPKRSTAAFDSNVAVLLSNHSVLDLAVALTGTTSGRAKIFATALVAFVLTVARVALTLSLDPAALPGRFLLATTKILFAGLVLTSLIRLPALSAACGRRTHGLLITFTILIPIFVFLVCHIFPPCT